MVQTIAIAETITSLDQLEERFNIIQAQDEQFFTEWFEVLPEIAEPEKQALDLVKSRYLYHRKQGNLSEGTVQLIVVSKLLELAGFYDTPFKISSEQSIKIEVADREEIYRGRIDVLVVQDDFWVSVIESKQTTFNTQIALPQALTYMLASPNTDRPTFGVVTNGSHFMFIKLVKNELAQYSFSDEFSIYRRQNELYDVLRVMKKIGSAIAYL